MTDTDFDLNAPERLHDRAQVLVYRPGAGPSLEWITANEEDGGWLEALQGLVGGLIDRVYLGRFALIIDDEGLCKEYAPTMLIPDIGLLVGPVVVMALTKENFRGLTPSEVVAVKAIIEEHIELL